MRKRTVWDTLSNSEQRDAQEGSKCCICGKDSPKPRPLTSARELEMIVRAQAAGATIRQPKANLAHPLCVSGLSAWMRAKGLET